MTRYIIDTTRFGQTLQSEILNYAAATNQPKEAKVYVQIYRQLFNDMTRVLTPDYRAYLYALETNFNISLIDYAPSPVSAEAANAIKQAMLLAANEYWLELSIRNILKYGSFYHLEQANTAYAVIVELEDTFLS